RLRPQLRAIAYRMLGSLTEADDAVQDTWLRLTGSAGEPIRNLPGWLTTVVGRVCIDLTTRQLASRARRRVQGAPTAPDPDLATQRRVVDAFLAAAREGDFDALITLLDPDATFHVDAGDDPARARPLLSGAAAVAAEILSRGPSFAASCHPALVNGAAGVVVRPGSTIIAVAAVTVIDERITEIDLIIDPAKLARLNIHGN
ncbi:MAG: sigma factor, partial [Trebonia sp.]